MRASRSVRIFRSGLKKPPAGQSPLPKNADRHGDPKQLMKSEWRLEVKSDIPRSALVTNDSLLTTKPSP